MRSLHKKAGGHYFYREKEIVCCNAPGSTISWQDGKAIAMPSDPATQGRQG